MENQATKTQTTRRVALIYARKSVVKSKQDEISTDRQVDLCTAKASEHGWTVEIFKDAEGHRSGGSEKHRPEWRRLKLQLARPDVAAVIVADILRASRSPKDFYNFLDECNRYAVQFISLKQQFDTTSANGRAMLGIALIFGAWEREIASERSLIAINFKRDKALHVGNAPFGTRRDDKGVLVESQDWETCRAALEEYATGNYSFYSLAQRLNARGLRFRNRLRQAVPFDKYVCRSIISNVLIYAGYVVRGRGKDMQIPKTLDAEGDVLKELAEYVGAVKGSHAPFISPDLAAQIIHVRFRMSKPRDDATRRVYILYPTLYCAQCGGRLRGSFKGGRPLYVHEGRVCQRRAAAMRAEPLEAQVLERLRRLRLTPEQQRELRERVESRLRATPEQAAIAETIRNLERKRERLKELYVEGDVDRTQYEVQRKTITAEIAEWQVKAGPRLASLETIFAKLDNLADLIGQGTPYQQRRALADLFERIEVDLAGNTARIIPRGWVKLVFDNFCAQLNATAQRIGAAR